MEISARAVGSALLIDMSGEFPRDMESIEDGSRRLREAIDGREDFILVFQDVELRSSIDLGILIRWLKDAGVKMGALGAGPFVRVVSDDQRIQQVLSVADMPFSVYATEEEALSPRKSGCLPAVLSVIVWMLAWWWIAT